jgi:hypothetical protein
MFHSPFQQSNNYGCHYENQTTLPTPTQVGLVLDVKRQNTSITLIQ